MALRLSESFREDRISYESLHTMQRRATPIKMMTYKHLLLLHKLNNSTDQNDDWMDLNYQQNFNDQNNMIHIVDYSRMRVGKNILANRLSIINEKISLDWLNLSFDSFKIKCKEKCLAC